MKPTKRRVNRVFMLLLMAWTLPLNAQTDKQFSLELNNKALPAALKQIEKEGGKNIIFSYNETENYRVTASIRQKSEAEAIRIILQGTPFVSKEKEAYFVIQKKGKTASLIEIKGRVTDEKDAPLPYSNVLLLTATDSTFINGCVTKQDGSFLLVAEEGIPYTLKTSYIGYQTHIQPCRPMNHIRLSPDTQMMQEVTVTASRPLIEAQSNGIKANVAGTSLAKMGSAAEMLTHLPFVTGSDGSYNVIGHGAPVIYINSRKVRDRVDLERLRANEIVSAEVITTPGAEYGSDVRAVIRLRTIRQRGKGMSGNFNVTYSQGHSYNASENVSLNYRIGGLDIFTKGYVSHGDSYGTMRNSHQLDGNSQWLSENDVITTEHGKTRFSGEVGFNYEPDEKQSFGLRYMPNTNLKEYETVTQGTTTMKQDDALVDNVDYTSHQRLFPQWGHSVNAYYNANLDKWIIDLNMDYLFGRSSSSQSVINDGVTSAQSENRVRNYLYAANLKISRTLGKGKLTFGSEEVFTNRHDIFTQSGFSSNANDHIRQSIYSVFADYSVKLNQFHFSAGMRYEHQQTDYYENDVHQEEQSPTYDDLIPVLSVSYTPKDWNFSLSYRLLKLSPLYSMLASGISYNSKYEYQTGDPFLVPQKHHFFSLKGSWKWIFAHIYYDKTHNMYTRLAKPYNEETHPGVMLFTMASIPVTYSYGANFYIAPTIGCWQPNLSFGIDLFDSDGTSIGITQLYREPQFSFSLDNSFNLPKGWFFNIQANLSTGCKQSYAIMRTAGRVNVLLSKSFLKADALTISATGNDILHTGQRYFSIYGDHTFIKRTTYNDSQRFGIQVSYKFNATKSKYKGTGAGQNEKQRL